MVDKLLALAARLVSEKPFRVKEFPKTFLTLSRVTNEKMHSLSISQNKKMSS